jgi:tripartite-type tricarboxylate transporter receptor subunit TctC
MNSSAAGLSVRFFKVTIPIGQGVNGKSTGKILSPNRFALKCSMTAGRVPRKRPSFGPGTPHHIAEEALKRAAKANWTYVPFPAGDAPAVSALLGGHITVLLATYSGVMEQLKAGTLRPIAVTERVRIAPLPDVPTVAESGHQGFAESESKDFEASGWLGVVAPAGTSKEVIAHLSTLFASALKAPEVTSKLLPQALYPVGSCGADFGSYIRKQYDEYARTIREANIRVE